ncbi:MAG TPA: hypothetical protein VEU33_30770, partial [Archangium sp.]|nr:hypothetical protein [Archangium sp.]
MERTHFRLSELAQQGALALRRQVNDLFGVLELPSSWQGREPEELARGILEVLVSRLRLDVALLKLHGPEGVLDCCFPPDLDREALLAAAEGAANPGPPVTFTLPRPNVLGRTTIRL